MLLPDRSPAADLCADRAHLVARRRRALAPLAILLAELCGTEERHASGRCGSTVMIGRDAECCSCPARRGTEPTQLVHRYDDSRAGSVS